MTLMSTKPIKKVITPKNLLTHISLNVDLQTQIKRDPKHEQTLRNQQT